MTRIVATALGDTPDELYERAVRAAREADLVEIRLDAPSGLPWDLRPYFALLGKPAIATVRAAEEGGASHADDETRAQILRRALRAGARWIDVELWHESAAELAREAHDLGARVIVSMHDLEGTPPADQLLASLHEARALGADVAKIATRVQGPEDAVALVETALAARRQGIPAALMAVNDPFLRLLAPGLGLAFVYASVGDAPAAAPGQVPAAKVRDVHEDLARHGAGGARARGTTRLVALLGHPVAHSKSPGMQNAAFAAAQVDATYVALDVAPEGLAAAFAGLRTTNALGANVTVPHKLEAMRLCDTLDPSARRAGAVNTIVLEGGRATGHNTDGAGALDALREAGVDVAGREALVLGAGGAARAVIASLVDAGARVRLANRTRATAEALARDEGAGVVDWEELDAALPETRLLVNATSLGLQGAAPPVNVKRLADDAAVFDCVYRAGGTALVQEARACGLKAVTGESMLLHQGARAFRLWTGLDAPLAAMRAALEEQGDPTA